MTQINKVAVIGAGTMGSGIASHLSNAGIPVLLFDIPGKNPDDPNEISKQALQRMLQSAPPALMDKKNIDLITPLNLRDDLHRLSEVDWIAEAIVERIDVKRSLYEKIDAHRSANCLLSSNTSTLPLELLTEGMSDALKKDFCITHFFNPVRYMRLLEIVAGPKTRPQVIQVLTDFCDRQLGKGVVNCRDTPGFLGNRVGVFALQAGIIEAAAQGLSVEEADAIMGRPMGIPKTGVFGLYDLIGIDLMLDVVKSLQIPLPKNDTFNEVAAGLDIIHKMVSEGYTGNKGKGGFYRQQGTQRETIDLETGEYRGAQRPNLDALRAAESAGLKALLEYPDRYGRFAWRVLARTFCYAASLLPQVADSPGPVDEAMTLGYSWSKGPFQMIDELGSEWFRQRLIEDNFEVPAIFDKLSEGTFYRVKQSHIQEIHFDGTFRDVPRAEGVVRLADLKASRTRISGNQAASLWDIGDGVVCLEFHTKANALSPESMHAMASALEITGKDHQALLIHNDAPHFSVGFNLEFALSTARRQAWNELDSALNDFQNTCKAAKYAAFPVVAAPSGLALGGGFEVLLGCDLIQTHSNITLGLVETMVGLVPGGGGCKEMLHRWTHNTLDPDEAQTGALEVFSIIGMARTASSPVEARRHRLLLERDHSTMNRDRLLNEAKQQALLLVNDYTPPAPTQFVALGSEGLDVMQAVVAELSNKGIASPHDVTTASALARILCGGDRTRGEIVSEQQVLDLEREIFLELSATQGTVDRIAHMLDTGQALRN